MWSAINRRNSRPTSMLQISRNSLYFNEYTHKIELSFRGRRVFKDFKLQKKPYYRQMDLYEGEFYHLCMLSDVLKELTSPNKQNFTWGSIHIYTSDIEDIKKLTDCIKSYEIPCDYMITKICHVGSKDKTHVYLRDPKYQFRSYFNHVNLLQHQQHQLWEFLDNNSADCRPTRTVSKILQNQHPWRKHWMQTSDFIDHNFTDQELLMLNLIIPNLFKCTKPIKAK